MAERNETTSDFEHQFDPEWYISNYTNNSMDKINDKGREIWYFSLDKLHETFSSGEIKGYQLLDVGTGPTINSIISASDHVEEIYLSDYTRANRDILSNWMNSKRDLDFSSFQYILGKQRLETADVALKQNQIRSKVKAILPIDVNNDLPFRKESGHSEFDVMTTKLCLESACGTVAEYRKSVKTLVSLMKPGGHIVMVGVTGCTWYRVGDRKFKNVCLKHSDVMAAFEDAGADVLKYEINHGSGRHNLFDTYKDIFFIVAKIHE